jgi:hypothetical protein
MPVAQLTYLKLRIIVDSPRSTAHLIAPEVLFSLVSGEKADNQNKFIKHLSFLQSLKSK